MPTVSELLEALPTDEELQRESPEESMLIGPLSQKPVPVGALRRLWSLSGLHARVGLAYLAC